MWQNVIKFLVKLLILTAIVYLILALVLPWLGVGVGLAIKALILVLLVWGFWLLRKWVRCACGNQGDDSSS